jgi:hypothetical protein
MIKKFRKLAKIFLVIADNLSDARHNSYIEKRKEKSKRTTPTNPSTVTG